jgi:hypothetical protein
MDQPKAGQGWERTSQPNIGGLPTFDSHKQTHAKKGKAIDEKDGNNVGRAEDQLSLVFLFGNSLILFQKSYLLSSTPDMCKTF